jgi:hypothetical protein
VKLIDFGLAAVADWRLTNLSLYAAGSRPYMAPEQFDGLKFCTKRSDLYSLGVTLFQMAAGQPPFTADTDHGYLSAHKDKSPPRLLDVNPGAQRGTLLDSVQNIVTKLLAKHPEERFQSARELKEEIDRARSGGLVSRPKITRPEGVRARKRATRILLLLAAPILAGAAVWLIPRDDADQIARARDVLQERGRRETARRVVEAVGRQAEEARLGNKLKEWAETADRAHSQALASDVFTREELAAFARGRETAEASRRERFETVLVSATARLEAGDESSADGALSGALEGRRAREERAVPGPASIRTHPG